MKNIDEVRMEFGHLQELHAHGEHAALKEYLCRVTGRPYCRICGDFHVASLDKHPIALLKEFVAAIWSRGR